MEGEITRNLDPTTISPHPEDEHQITQSAQSSASVKALEKPLLAVRYVSKSQISCQLKSVEFPVAKFIHKLQRASNIKGEYYLLQSSPLQNGHSKKLISSLKYSCQNMTFTDQAEVIQAAIFFWKWLSAQKEHMLTEMCQTWHILRITEISCREAWFFHHFHPHRPTPGFLFSGHE